MSEPGPDGGAAAPARALGAGAIATRVSALVTPELVEEHRQHPVGSHSAPLRSVLDYFRQLPTAGKLALVTAEAGSFAIVRLSGVPGVAPERIGDGSYVSEDAALHGVFLRRLREAGMWDDDA